MSPNTTPSAARVSADSFDLLPDEDDIKISSTYIELIIINLFIGETNIFLRLISSLSSAKAQFLKFNGLLY